MVPYASSVQLTTGFWDFRLFTTVTFPLVRSWMMSQPDGARARSFSTMHFAPRQLCLPAEEFSRTSSSRSRFRVDKALCQACVGREEGFGADPPPLFWRKVSRANARKRNLTWPQWRQDPDCPKHWKGSIGGGGATKGGGGCSHGSQPV